MHVYLCNVGMYVVGTVCRYLGADDARQEPNQPASQPASQPDCQAAYINLLQEPGRVVFPDGITYPIPSPCIPYALYSTLLYSTLLYYEGEQEQYLEYAGASTG